MNSFADDTQSAESASAEGAPASSPPQDHPRQPLRRPAKGRMLAGVAAGISRHFNVDVTIVRVAFAVLAIIGFTGLAYLGSLPLYLGGIPLYLACWLLIPEEGSDHSIASAFFRHAQDRSAERRSR